MEGWRETGLPLPSLTPPEAQTPQREPTTASFTSFPLNTWDKSQEGTRDNVIDDILKTNFDLKFAKSQAHGRGNYFSEYPEVSLGYGPGLIFCELLTGKEYRGSDLEWKKHGDSKVCSHF